MAQPQGARLGWGQARTHHIIQLCYGSRATSEDKRSRGVTQSVQPPQGQGNGSWPLPLSANNMTHVVPSTNHLGPGKG